MNFRNASSASQQRVSKTTTNGVYVANANTRTRRLRFDLPDSTAPDQFVPASMTTQPRGIKRKFVDDFLIKQVQHEANVRAQKQAEGACIVVLWVCHNLNNIP